jgi:hypothetical protein
LLGADLGDFRAVLEHRHWMSAALARFRRGERCARTRLIAAGRRLLRFLATGGLDS